MIKNNIFISHASEDKEILVEPFIRCLEQNGIRNYWYDEEQIETGDIIVERINEALSSSKIVVIIFSKNYLQKHWTIWELMVILTLLITHKIRIIPFISDDINYHQIVEEYPIMAPIRFESIPSCDEIVSIINRKLEETNIVFENPVSSFRYEVNSNSSDNKQEIKENMHISDPEDSDEVNDKKLLEIYEELADTTIPEVKKWRLQNSEIILQK